MSRRMDYLYQVTGYAPPAPLPRVAAQLDQPDAKTARRLHIAPSTWSNYRTGRYRPSYSQTVKIVKRLARGKPERDEPEPQYLVSFQLLGQRLLDDGGLLVFENIYDADWVADRLEKFGLTDVAIWPCWRSALDDVAPEEKRHYIESFDDDEACAEVVRTGLSTAFERLIPEVRQRIRKLSA